MYVSKVVDIPIVKHDNNVDYASPCFSLGVALIMLAFAAITMGGGGRCQGWISRVRLETACPNRNGWHLRVTWYVFCMTPPVYTPVIRVRACLIGRLFFRSGTYPWDPWGTYGNYLYNKPSMLNALVVVGGGGAFIGRSISLSERFLNAPWWECPGRIISYHFALLRMLRYGGWGAHRGKPNVCRRASPCSWTHEGGRGEARMDNIPNTTINMYQSMCVCFVHLHAFLRRQRIFSLGCEARGGGACTPRRKFDSRTGSVARALGVRSREIWHVNMGSLSAELRAGLAKNRFFTRPAVSPPFGNIATQS